MGKESSAPADKNARYEVPEAKRGAARRWFDQAKKLVEQRNYEYAIKSFVEGLGLDPEAVEDGYQPLRGCAIARWQTGGKKPSMVDNVKYSTTTKDPIKGLVNAAWLFAHDPNNAGYAEGILKNANKARCEDALFWIGPIYAELLNNDKKHAAKKYGALKDIYEELGDRCQARGEIDRAVTAYEQGIEALAAQRNLDSTNRALDNVMRDLSTKLTILKGHYQTAEDFRDSIRDSESQARLHDEDRLVQSADRISDLIEKAKAEFAANPDVEAKVLNYVQMLCKDETDEHENEAIGVLTEKFEQSTNYRYKLRADDIRIRQMGRHARQARAAGKADEYKDLLRRKLSLEETAYRERVAKYPTDLRLKFEFARRLFLLRKFDEAIPLFQQARTEPKVRFLSLLHLGRCFFEKCFYSQSIGILEQAMADYELEDEISKELAYWFGRSLEAEGRADDAKQAYGNLLQIDYNYRDVKDRLAGLK